MLRITRVVIQHVPSNMTWRTPWLEDIKDKDLLANISKEIYECRTGDMILQIPTHGDLSSEYGLHDAHIIPRTVFDSCVVSWEYGER